MDTLTLIALANLCIDLLFYAAVLWIAGGVLRLVLSPPPPAEPLGFWDIPGAKWVAIVVGIFLLLIGFGVFLLFEVLLR